MFRLWGKMMKENRMLRDIVISNGDYTMSRTAMVFDAIDQICYAFDLGHPVWLDKKAHLALLQCVGVSAPQQNPFQKRQFYRGNSF